ncbi:uncharacterized protein C8A04DRAFT_8718 [Dichotomopilus funicola]|uniref:BRCT domain-containing protein n=1 Tax=Dichotomopilus funicola TaxID=1934379 RepID=A0AAN6ZSX0_9PEZI|nr:hypothetical protein C8A04DRAFT_8718 [Dichotomopilus funicola]
MDPQSPPKRMTRARAAAKSTNRVVTAAAKAKTARTTATTSTTTTTSTTKSTRKRKTPSEDEEDDHEMPPAKKVTLTAATTKATRGRGRPKKETVAPSAAPTSVSQPVPDETAAAPAARGRGRPKKTTVEPAVEEPAKTTARGTRTKKTATEQTTTSIAQEDPVKKTARGRPAAAARATTTASTTTAATASKPLAKPAVKKTVKFEEPEKENIIPDDAAVPTARGTATKATPTTAAGGLRGKPIRKAGGSATARGARGTKAANNTSDATENGEKPMPLSPKKLNQLTVNRAAESDDELGMEEKVPVQRFKKLPIKPTSGTHKTSAKSQATVATNKDEDALSGGVGNISRPETEVNLMLATPAKRLPPTPWKGSINSPAKRVEGLLLGSEAQNEGKTPQVSTKAGLLQSPAKRQPLNLNPGGGHDNAHGFNTSPVKLSFLSSPAKRPPISPIKLLPKRIEEQEEEEEEPMNRTPAPKPTLLASPTPQRKTPEPVADSEDVDADIDVDGNEVIPDSPTRPSFQGRMSAVLPRHADPTLTPPVVLTPGKMEEHEDKAEEAKEEKAEEHDEAEEVQVPGERMVLDDEPVEAPADLSLSTTPPSSPPKIANPMFGLRDKDLQAYESESEDDSPVKKPQRTSAFSNLPATPCPASARRLRTAQSANRSTAKKTKNEEPLGFTPLAQQLNAWSAGESPLMTRNGMASPVTQGFPLAEVPTEEVPNVERNGPITPSEPAENNFFEDEMVVRPDSMDVDVDEEDAATEVADDEQVVLEDLSFTEEDMELAAEANEMSLMEKDPASPHAAVPSQEGDDEENDNDNDETISEASQEYANENAVPNDPTLTTAHNSSPRRNSRRLSVIPHSPAAASPSAVAVAVAPTPAPAPTGPVTPQRVLRSREVHTVAKVPLKAADNSTPRTRLETRSHSASRVSAARPSGRLARNSTVISYSPTKRGSDDVLVQQRGVSIPPVTPQKTAELWSAMGTPARTPHRNLDSALLRGAVVFVDVYTSEGEDASSIFVELLTQMGARCVPTWEWNPSSESESDSRVEITHVVFKDGAKRTLEQVRVSGGVVQCVGVSWVLDCERDNEWLDEAPYSIDTSLAPRSKKSHRRKTMEPRAMANQHSGGLVPSPSPGRKSTGGSQTAPTTPTNYNKRNRRDSSLWVRSPDKSFNMDDGSASDDSDADGDDDDDVENRNNPRNNNNQVDYTQWGPLTPVPKTPAPEAIARYVANITPGSATPSSVGSSVDDEKDNDDRRRREEMMLQRTCPPPKRTALVESGPVPLALPLNRERDESVMMRLMAARRKSLQFAPKIGSPLSKAWKAWN